METGRAATLMGCARTVEGGRRPVLGAKADGYMTCEDGGPTRVLVRSPAPLPASAEPFVCCVLFLFSFWPPDLTASGAFEEVASRSLRGVRLPF
eukprot:684479-Rhodomonas_salina.2